MQKLGLLTFILLTLASFSFAQTPTTAKGWFDLGNRQMDSYKYEDAIKSFTECAKLSPKSPGCFANRAFVYDQIGRRDLALPDYNYVVQLVPNDGQIYKMRGVHYHSQGKLDLALADFNKAIQLKPEIGETYAYRGDILLKKGETTSALNDLTKSIELSPKFTMPYRVRGEYYCNEGKIQLARQDEQKATELGATISKNCYAKGKTMPSYDWIQIQLLSVGTNEAVREIVNEMLPKYPDCDVLYYERAKLYVRQKKFAEAKQDFAKARELNPDNTEAKRIQFMIQAEEANTTPKPTSAPKPVAPKIPNKRENAEKIANQAENILNEGAALLEQGKVTDAETKLKLAFPEINKAIETDQTYSKAQQLLGMYYFLFSMSPNDKNSKMSKTLAIFAFDKAIELDAKNARAYFGKGLMFEMTGNKPEAKANYQKALQINPNEKDAKEGLKRIGN